MSERFARLDLQGGIAGDMFVAAMIDAFPELVDLIGNTLECLSLPQGVVVSADPFHDGIFGGRQVRIDAPEKGEGKTRLVGDVDYASAAEVAGAITPVPGGVGPMTIATLIEQTALGAERRAGLA